MDSFDIQRIVGPLRAVFWGGLICVFDINFSQTANGSGFKLDIINDFVGMLIVTWGVYHLSELRVHEQYAAWMKGVLVISILNCFLALHEHFIYRVPPPISFALLIIGLASLVASVAFTVAMRWLCESSGLMRSAESWRVTTILFVIIYLLPLGFVYAASAIAILANESFHIDLGGAGLLLLPVFAAPLIHLFVSTSRMIDEARELPPSDGDLYHGPEML